MIWREMAGDASGKLREASLTAWLSESGLVFFLILPNHQGIEKINKEMGYRFRRRLVGLHLLVATRKLSGRKSS